MGQGLYFIEATEPTNIIWENRHFTRSDRIKRGARVFGIIFILILVSFSLIFICKSFSISAASKYPQVDCEVITTSYGAEFERYAEQEWDDYYPRIQNNQDPKPLSGTLQCYCDAQAKDAETYNNEKICVEYNNDKYIALATSQGVSFMLVAINYTLRLFIIKLIMYIGKATESEQTQLVTDGVFVV